MDASEVIKKRLQAAQYSSYIQEAQAKAAACTSTSCFSTITTCVRQFKSYESRDAVMNGMKVCIGCSTICGVGQDAATS
jgi:hypothetical protein